uniref:Signal recognition particle receptor subunit beta n=2 Tax=Clastoptera arizonana TaxID=38151 RepID=A0A1B6E0T6_9HEMI
MMDENSYIKVEKAFWVDPFQMIGAVVGIIAVLITIIILVIFQQRKNARRSILIMGLSDSGKTLIFSRIFHNRCIQTYTSLKENSGKYLINNNFLRVIDIPGHERLCGKFFDQYKTSTKGIIFVVDSVTIQKKIRDVAELLYNILTDKSFASKGNRVLISCNKQDQTMAKGATVIKSLLEAELNLLRVTKAKQLNSTEDVANSNNYLGVIGKDFKFSHIPLAVEFVECAAMKNEMDAPADIKGIKMWIENIA